MERIVLEVDGALARAWESSSPALRSSYGHKIADLLRELIEVQINNLPGRSQKISKDKGFTKEQLECLKAEIAGNTERYEWWNDDEMMAELDRRSADLKSGDVKGISLEESKAYLIASLKKDGL